MSEKQYIFFDLDGTLTDPKVGITKSFQHSLRYFGINIENPDELAVYIGPPLRDTFKDKYDMDEDKVEQAVKYYREYFQDKGIYENTVYNDIEPLLEKLYNYGKTLVLATSKPEVYARQILEHFGLIKFFTFISGAELDGRRSAKCEVIKRAVDELKINDISQIIMVGDRSHDIIGAEQCKIDAVGVTYGYGSAEELKDAGAKYIAANADELERILLNHLMKE